MFGRTQDLIVVDNNYARRMNQCDGFMYLYIDIAREVDETFREKESERERKSKRAKAPIKAPINESY